MDNELTNVTIEEHDGGTTAMFTPEKQEEVFQRMKALFDRSGMTYSQLSRVTYISERTITRYFAGKTKDPHFYTLCTMIIAMCGDVNEILGITPSPDAPTPSSDPYGELIESYRNEAKTLRTAIEKITGDIGSLTARIAAAHKIIAVRTVIMILVIAVFCVLEIVDLCRPDWGRYQWALDLFGSFLHRM